MIDPSRFADVLCRIRKGESPLVVGYSEDVVEPVEAVDGASQSEVDRAIESVEQDGRDR